MADSSLDVAALAAAGADLVPLLNKHRSAFDRSLGLVFTHIGDDEIAADVPITPALLQPYGLVHGGVYAAIVETLASTGAGIDALRRGQSTVGLENTTSFLRGTRSGTLHARARPLHRGSRTQVWSVEIRDDAGREVGAGRVRMLCLDAGATIAGDALTIKTGQ